MTPHLYPGSAVDRKPLAPCHRCNTLQPQPGGLWMGIRFVCKACAVRLLK